MVHSTGDQTSMVPGQNPLAIPQEVFLACSGSQARVEAIEHDLSMLIEDSICGIYTRVETFATQIDTNRKSEFELMARKIISRALDEPQHIKACVSLSGVLQMHLPMLTPLPGQRGETFMHALLDVFQTEFEQHCDYNIQDKSQHSSRKRNRIRAIVHFAGHLYCQRLLGNGVVSQMVQELVTHGEPDFANELLWFISVFQNAEQHNLGTVLEDPNGSECASPEPSPRRASSPNKASADRRPSQPEIYQ